MTDPRKSRQPAPFHWRTVRWCLRRELRRTCHRHLANRALHNEGGGTMRWLWQDRNRFLETLDRVVEEMRETAELHALPNGGSRLMVELAVYTVAADAALRRHGISVDCAHSVVADIGWDLYSRMLRLSSLPARIVSRDAGRTLRWTIRTLLVFPFRPVGAPGYEARVFREGDDLQTHFTHCPPQSFAHRAATRLEDPELLEAFRQSWCLYDWPGADIIASDGRRGHYRRPNTLSAGDPVCDMCWRARGAKPSARSAENPDQAGALK